jgi:hypothetical protein
MPFIPDSTSTIKRGFRPDKKTTAGFIGNIIGSGVGAISDLGGAVINTINPDMEKNTVANLLRLGDGILSLVVPGEQINEKNAKAVGKFYVDRYGSFDKALNTLYNDPVGLALDVSTVISGAGGALKGAGSLSKIAELTKVGNAFSKAAAFTDPFSMMGKVGGKVTSKAGGKLASGLEKTSERVITQGLGNPRMLEKARNVSPIPLTDLFKKYNTYDRSSEAFQQGADVAGDSVKAMIAEAGSRGVGVDVLSVVKKFDQEIAKLEGKAQISDKAASALAELRRRKQMFVDSLSQQNGGLSTPLNANVQQVYDIKSQFQGDVPPSTFGMPTQDVGKTAGTTTAYRTLLNGIESAAPGIKNTGREQAALIKLKDVATASESRASARQPINFTKLGSTGVGSVLAGLPGAVAGMAAEQLVNSPQGVRAVSQGLGATASLLKNNRLRQATSRMGRVVSPGYNYAKAGRMANLIETPTQSIQKPQAQGVSNQAAKQPQPLSKPLKQSAYTPMPKLQPYKMPSQSKSTQAFGGSVKVKRGSFY